MEMPALQRHVQAADLQPERLAGNAHLTKEEKIGEASRQFEALLLRQILENSQKPVIKSKLNPDSTSSSIYRDLITSNLAESISKSGEFGLARTFEQQLNRQLCPASKDGKASPATQTQSEASAAASSSPPTHSPRWPFTDSFQQYEQRHQKTSAPGAVPVNPITPSLAGKNSRVPVRSPLRGHNFPPVTTAPHRAPDLKGGASISKTTVRSADTARGATLLISKP